MALAVLLLVGAVIVGALAVTSLAAGGGRRRRPERAKPGFASEYSRIVEDVGSSSSKAEAREPESPARRFPIRPLGPADRARHLEAWRAIQAEFGVDPAAAMASADRLLAEVMSARGYPMEDFDARADDIALGHPEVVRNYRIAHAVAARGEAASVEDLDQAVSACHVLVDELVGEPARFARATAAASLAARRQARAG
ncbi:MAG: hypothetical protein ACREEB_09430 [Caulobacteraceae bacterium]